MTQVAAVILAAGGSTRFGRCKQLLDWGGVSLLAHIADVALEAQLRPVIVVLGYGAKETYRVLGDRPVQKVMNWGWQAGKSTSLRIGLAAVPPESDAAVFLQCDQPLVTADLLQAVVNRFNGTGALIVHPTHAGRRGTPVLFSERLFAELSTVTGDQGGRVLIDRHPDQVATVDVDSMAVLTDVDTPEDYERLRSAAGFRTEADRENAASHLQPIRHLIIDMDGVLWTGDQPKAGLQQFFAFLDRQRIAFMLATNNSTSPPERYVAKLARYGVDVPAEMVLTSALASAAYMMDVARPGSKVYVIGEEGIREALEQHGFLLGDEGAEYVVVGWDRAVTWDKLATASVLIRDGADFIGTNPDVTYPTERGPVPGTGALLAAIETATGVAPIVTGKPQFRMYKEAMRRMAATPDTTAMIGDRLDTDIAGALRAGITAVLTLSGITTEDDLRQSTVRPDLVFADIRALLACWRNQVR